MRSSSVAPNTDDQNTAAFTYLQKLAKTMNIEIAQRFGAWDPEQMITVVSVDDLSVAAAESPSSARAS